MDKDLSIFVAISDPAIFIRAYNLVRALRNLDIISDTEWMGRSLKAQMRWADKEGFTHVIILGDVDVIKDMKSSRQYEVDANEFYSPKKEPITIKVTIR